MSTSKKKGADKPIDFEAAKKKIAGELTKYYEKGKERFSKAFNDSDFWNKVKDIVGKAGKELIVQALTLYYCCKDEQVPTGVKALIIAGLGYLILPVDLIFDAIIGIGLLDDIAVLGTVMVKVKEHITEEHKQQAHAKYDELFGKPQSKTKSKAKTKSRK